MVIESKRNSIIELKSDGTKADYIAASYIYNFLIEMGKALSDWHNVENLSEDTRELIAGVSGSMSSASVGIFPELNNLSLKYKDVIPSPGKWPETFLSNIQKGKGLEYYEEVLHPVPCWMGEKYQRR